MRLGGLARVAILTSRIGTTRSGEGYIWLGVEDIDSVTRRLEAFEVWDCLCDLDLPLSPLPKYGYVEGDQPVDGYHVGVVVVRDDDKRPHTRRSTVKPANGLRNVRDEDLVERLVARVWGIEKDVHPGRYDLREA